MHTECRPQMLRFTLKYSFAVVLTLMFIASTHSLIEAAKSESTEIKNRDLYDSDMIFIDDPPGNGDVIEGSGGTDEDDDDDDNDSGFFSGEPPPEENEFEGSGETEDVFSSESTDLSHSSTITSSTTTTTTTTTTSTTSTPPSTTMSDKPTKKESTKKPIFAIDQEVFRKNPKDVKESEINVNKIPDNNFVPESAETSTKFTLSTTPKSKDPSSSRDSNNEQGNGVSILGRKQDARPLSFFAQPGILAAVIGGAVVGLLCAILLVMFIVYRMRKKDEGSYALDEPKMSPAANPYAKGNSREFYA